jgi:hypothetical protein
MGGVSELERELLACAADVHAAMARLTAKVAEFDASRQWAGHGIQSIGHWSDINLGVAVAPGERARGRGRPVG